MNTDHRPAPPAPAPLPYTSKAARGEIPAPKPAPPEPLDPTAPRLREDEAALWYSIGCTGLVVALMVLWAALGGL